jgi:hypothetical protein
MSSDIRCTDLKLVMELASVSLASSESWQRAGIGATKTGLESMTQNFMYAIDGNEKVLDVYGKTVQEGGSDMTVGHVCVAQLLRPHEARANPPEPVLSQVEQSKRFTLALRIGNAMATGLPCGLEDNESVLLKQVVSKLGMPLLLGRVEEAIKPWPKPVEVVPVGKGKDEPEPQAAAA